LILREGPIRASEVPGAVGWIDPVQLACRDDWLDIDFAILGEYDFLSILEAPDDVTFSKVVVNLGSRGTPETNTLSAIPVDDFLTGLKP
jgi:hypothetical protein